MEIVTRALKVEAFVPWSACRTKATSRVSDASRDCGSPLTYEGERWPDQTHILVCSLDDPVALQPTAHVHTDEQLTWLHLADGLPRE